MLPIALITFVACPACSVRRCSPRQVGQQYRCGSCAARQSATRTDRVTRGLHCLLQEYFSDLLFLLLDRYGTRAAAGDDVICNATISHRLSPAAAAAAAAASIARVHCSVRMFRRLLYMSLFAFPARFACSRAVQLPLSSISNRHRPLFDAGNQGWRLATTLTGHHTRAVFSVAWSADDVIASASGDNSVCLFVPSAAAAGAPGGGAAAGRGGGGPQQPGWQLLWRQVPLLVPSFHAVLLVRKLMGAMW